MSRDQEDVASQPLVIVRRRKNADEVHHGGVWKIAYADFMTAMMAFFLVMWLVNAADKKTIVQVAAYFNPIRLTDRFATPKGLEDLTETETKPSDKKGKKGFLKEMIDEKQKQEAEQESKENIGEAMDEAAQKSSAAAGGKSDQKQIEQSLFDDPGNMLNKLADEARASQPTTFASPSISDSDPFDRVQRKSGMPEAAARPAPDREAKKSASAAYSDVTQESKVPGTTPGRKDGSQPEAAKAPVPGTPKKPLSNAAKEAVSNDAAKEPVSHDAAKEPLSPNRTKEPISPDEAKNASATDADAQAKKLQAELSEAISKVSKDLPQIEVKLTPEGLLISLLDDAKFGMFEVGSAKPRPEMVLVMDKVGEILRGRDGNLIIRGHTDSRAYKSGVYDNWRLSAARAQMAYYMLLRGGVADARVVAIEGRADRDPKLPNDTTAAPNRRIDILIKEPK